MITRELYRYWAKTGRDGEGRVACHVLVYHCLDVAAVGWVLLGRARLWLERLARVLGLEPEACRGLLVRLMMVHDIGKYMPSFQGLRLDAVAHLGGACPEPPPPYGVRHDTMGAWVWERVIWPWLWARRGAEAGAGIWPPPWEDDAEAMQELLWPLVAATMGHHGTPPEASRPQAVGLRALRRGRVREAIEAHIEGCWGLLDAPPALPPSAQVALRCSPVGSWAVAGLMVVCDWLGSDRRMFPFEEAPMALETYWRERALVQAERAVSASGLEGREAAPWRGFEGLFPELRGYGPRPMQRWASGVELGRGPHLAILEDETGSGKTEAALVLAHRLMAGGEAQGVYVALPTMATANAMYGRLAVAYRRLFVGAEGEGAPSLVLAHGQAGGHAGFRATVVRDAAPDGACEDACYGSRGETTATAYCGAWLADRRKAALWADVGVGTVDQALAGVLPVRHQAMRLGGLMRSVLIVDEVHGYDPYMTVLLERLLRVQAAFGGSAVLLSATLPASVRAGLVEAFALGLSDAGLEAPRAEAAEAAPEAEALAAYPRAEVAWPGGGSTAAVASQRAASRRVGVAWVEAVEAAVEVVAAAAEAGQCACWIRNTVDDAREGAEAVAARLGSGAKVTLFHARFTGADRAQIEAEVVRCFGPTSGAATRAGRVVVATQVVEQSLDVDFDVMVTDLAPIDLVVQRAGRLRRHRRDARGARLEGAGADGRGPVVLHVLAPAWDDAPDGGWYRRLLPRASYVYRHVGQLWLTMRALRDGGGWETPGGVRACVEAVYGAQAQAQVPEALALASARALTEATEQYDAGEAVALRVALGYGAADHGRGWARDERAMTRLGEPTVTARLVEQREGRWVPLGAASWAQAEVRVARRRLADGPEGADAPWLDAMPDRARWAVVVPMVRAQLQEGGDGVAAWEGHGRDGSGASVQLRYTRAWGLEVRRDATTE